MQLLGEMRSKCVFLMDPFLKKKKTLYKIKLKIVLYKFPHEESSSCKLATGNGFSVQNYLT